MARTHFPEFKIVRRARNVMYLFELYERGTEVVERETFEAALLIGQRALQQLGIDEATAALARAAFRSHDLSRWKRWCRTSALKPRAYPTQRWSARNWRTRSSMTEFG